MLFRSYGGTGLGLSISKQLVEMMHGQIGVDSVLGQGSTFWFTVELEHAAQPVKKAPPLMASFAQFRALIVDDSELNRQILSEQVAKWSLRTEQASNGTDALALLRKQCKTKEKFDVAILDFHMPEMDGVELARAIKADPDIQATHLVLLSSVNEKLIGDAIAASGIECCLKIGRAHV